MLKKKRLGGVRTSVRRFCAVVGVGYLAACGTYMGMKRMCDLHQIVKDQLPRSFALAGRRMSQEDADELEAAVMLLDISHAIGHLLRDKSDRASLKEVMQKFHSMMKPESTEDERAEDN